MRIIKRFGEQKVQESTFDSAEELYEFLKGSKDWEMEEEGGIVLFSHRSKAFIAMSVSRGRVLTLQIKSGGLTTSVPVKSIRLIDATNAFINVTTNDKGTVNLKLR